jgi:glycosyltransferase involved in cell wall biosynthesis
MERPLVSVIIPNYNYARFLSQRIDSVLGQTYENLEVIILDDKSTDDSRSVIESYREDPRVTHILYNETNSGSTFKQWQKGFELARGSFIWIAEADDYAAPTLVEKLMENMAEDADIKVGFVNSYWVAPDRQFINSDYTISEEKHIYDGKEFVCEHLLKENYIYNASMAIFRKDVIADIGLEYMSFRSCGDKLFWRNAAIQGKVLYVCEPLNFFRIHQAKVTTNSIASGLLFNEENRLYHLNVVDGFIDANNNAEVIRYFLKYIKSTKKGFQSKAIYKQVKKMWKDERPHRYPHLHLYFRPRKYLHLLRNSDFYSTKFS